MKRSLAILATCATVGMSVFAATPAWASTQADTRDDVGVATTKKCQAYLKDNGYKVGPKVKDACNHGAVGEIGACRKKLVSIEVEKAHALDACHIADIPRSQQHS